MIDEKLKVFTNYDVRVPMRDGIHLSADIILPQDAKSGERFPVILWRTPYNKALALVKTIENFRAMAEQGFVVVMMDVRGRGDSDGFFVPYRNDARDGYDAIEWCAAQSWSTGKVGTLGASYSGRIQWLTALLNPPHLTTMIVLVTPSDPFVESPTGTPGPMHICWEHMTSGKAMQSTEVINWMEIYDHLPLITMDEAVGRTSSNWKNSLAHTQLDDYWEAISYQDKFHQIDVPVMHISGWYDDEQIGTPLNFSGMIKNGATERTRKSQKLLMGPWGHATNDKSKLGEVDFGPSAIIDLRDTELRWFDYWLKDKANGVAHETPVRIFIMGDNVWRDEREWPLARTKWTPFYLQSNGNANSRFGDGTLSQTVPQTQAPDHYRYDPSRPCPFITEPTSSQIGGPDDYASIERRDDVLVFVTEPLKESIEVTGPIRLELYAASSAVDTDFAAKLIDVHPSGFVQRLCDGMVRARFRDGMDSPKLIEPGQVYKFGIDLWNTAQVFLRGHRIGLEISSSAFPKYDRNLNTGEDLATGTRMIAADQTIYHDAEHPSVLTLPIIPRE